MSGNSGNDILHGGSGNDNLFGNSGDDELYGGSGDVEIGETDERAPQQTKFYAPDGRPTPRKRCLWAIYLVRRIGVEILRRCVFRAVWFGAAGSRWSSSSSICQGTSMEGRSFFHGIHNAGNSSNPLSFTPLRQSRSLGNPEDWKDPPRAWKIASSRAWKDNKGLAKKKEELSRWLGFITADYFF